MAANDRIYSVLFLCTGNSARSLLAESLLNHFGEGRFKAYSAGSRPTGRANPYAIDLLRSVGLPTDGLRSKSWDEFAGPGAPTLDFVITVCDNAAGESCPYWPGQPVTAHWGIADPAAATGTPEDIARAFRAAYLALEQRISLFVSLPVQSLDRLSLSQRMSEIGQL